MKDVMHLSNATCIDSTRAVHTCSECGNDWMAEDFTVYGCDLHTDEERGDRYLSWQPCCEAQHNAVMMWGFEEAYGVSIRRIAQHIAPHLDVLEVSEPDESSVVCRLQVLDPVVADPKHPDAHGHPKAVSPKGWRARVFDAVDEHHRHHDAPLSHKFSVEIYNGDLRVGVAVIGRPVSRRLQEAEPHTLEVLRVCTWGHHSLRRNASSKLYAAAAKRARQFGYNKLITYTLHEQESGGSLVASGWEKTKITRPESWNRSSRPRKDKAPTCAKVRWEKGLTKAMKKKVAAAAMACADEHGEA
jgi:hypothetical protein